MQAAMLIVVLANLMFSCYFCLEYFRLKRVVTYVISPLCAVRNMANADEFIDQLLSQEGAKEKSTGTTAAMTIGTEKQEQKRARLAAIVAGGTAKKYLGKQPTLAQVDEMTDDEVSKHYQRYEARLGASMTKTLGASALQMYALLAGGVLPIPPENRPQLVSDLSEDPFVQHALTTACCELYYRYGMYLAPLTAAMTTAKHCRFGHQGSLANTEDGRDVDAPAGDSPAGDSPAGDSPAGDSPAGGPDQGDD